MRRKRFDIYAFLSGLAIGDKNARLAQRANLTGKGEPEPIRLHYGRRCPTLAEIEEDDERLFDREED